MADYYNTHTHTHMNTKMHILSWNFRVELFSESSNHQRKPFNTRNLITTPSVFPREYISLNPIYDKHKHELVACLIINKHFKLIFIQNGLWAYLSTWARTPEFATFWFIGPTVRMSVCVCVRVDTVWSVRWCVCVCVWWLFIFVSIPHLCLSLWMMTKYLQFYMRRH